MDRIRIGGYSGFARQNAVKPSGDPGDASEMDPTRKDLKNGRLYEICGIIFAIAEAAAKPKFQAARGLQEKLSVLGCVRARS